MTMQVFTTKGLPPKVRREYWNDAICETFTELVTDFTSGQDFNAELSTVPLADLTYSRVRTSKSHVKHTQQHVSKTKEDIFLLHLQLENSSLNSQYGRSSHLGIGDFTLVDSTSPYNVLFDDPISMGVMCIPHKVLSKKISNPEDIVGHKFYGDKGVSGMLSQMLRSFWMQNDFNGSDHINAQLADNILDLLTISIQNQFGNVEKENSVRKIRFLQIQKFIEYNLKDPELSPQKIAIAFNITPRYLHQIFSEFHTQTVGQYLLSRRLDECANAFQNNHHNGLTITEIAFDWGFNSMTHFSRVFKEKFDLSPRAFRQNI